MLISRAVKGGWDSVSGEFRLPYRTRGIYGHLPRLWSCKAKNWTYEPSQVDDYEFVQEMNKDLDEIRESHSGCKIISRHILDAGFLRWVGKNRTLTFWYMGNPYRHKIFEWGKNRTIEE